ncbi:MAG: sigma-70 family RNA polymerase sigma factor [Planctomycetes bacterium]|nr:sigma-70 family RNA polymerase sigma factor [Planctomycetota bacterium]
MHSAGKEIEHVRAVVSANHLLVYRVSYRILGNQADAEDATQEVFLRYVKDPARPPVVRSLRAWLARVAINTSRNMIRAERNRRRRERSWAEDRGAEGEAASGGAARGAPGGGDAMENRRAVAEAVEALPDDLRLPLVLHFQEGFKYREIASALDCPEGTVAKRIFTAKERLRAYLRKRGNLAALPSIEGLLPEPPAIPVPAGLEARILERVVSALGAAPPALARSAGVHAARAPAGALRRALIASSIALGLGIGAVALRPYFAAGTAAREPVSAPLAPTAATAAAAQSGSDAHGATAGVGAASAGAERTALPRDTEAASVAAGAIPRPPAIAGQVRDEAGAPIAGAEVSFIAARETIASTETDEEGRFALWIQDEHVRQPIGERLADGAAQPSDRGTDALPGDGEILIAAPGEEPAAAGDGFQITAGGAEGESASESIGAGIAASPPESGEGSAEPVRGVLPGFVEAHADGYLPARSAALEVKTGETCGAELQLAAALEIAGIVVSAEGSPVAGAEIAITVHNGAAPVARKDAVAQSGADGRFRIRNVPAGSFLLQSKAPGHAEGRAVATAGGEHALIALERAGSLRLRLNAPGGAAAGADVEARLARGDFFAAYGLSDGNGEILLADMQPGNYELYLYRGAFPLLATNVDIAPDAERALDLEVAAGHRLRGRVVFLAEDGADATGSVTALYAKERAGIVQPWQETEVDRGGAFALHALPPGAYRLCYRRGEPGFGRSDILALASVDVSAQSEITEVEIEVDPKRLATVAASAVSEAEETAGGMIATLSLRFGSHPRDLLQVASAWTETAGETVTLRAPPGTYELTARGFDGSGFAEMEVALAAGEHVERRLALTTGDPALSGDFAEQLPASMTIDVSEKATLRGYFEFVRHVARGAIELEPALAGSGFLDREGVFPVRMPIADHLRALLAHFELVAEPRGDTIFIGRAAR